MCLILDDLCRVKHRKQSCICKLCTHWKGFAATAEITETISEHYLAQKLLTTQSGRDLQ